MQVRKLLIGVLGVAVLSALTVLSVAAASLIPNDSPANALVIDNQTHTAPVGLSAWYRFNYYSSNHPKDRTPITLTLVNGNNSNVAFEVYTSDAAIDRIPDGLEDWRQNDPIGQGTAPRMTCDSHIPKANGACVSNDLTWTGTLAESGTVYVRVRNDNQVPTNFTLTVQGADVSLAPQAIPPAP